MSTDRETRERRLTAALIEMVEARQARTAREWPRTTDDGRGMIWACCVSSIGPVCQHIRTAS